MDTSRLCSRLCVTERDMCNEGQKWVREILSPLLRFEPWKFPFLRKTKKELSIEGYKQVHRVPDSLRKFRLCLDQGKRDVFFVTSI